MVPNISTEMLQAAVARGVKKRRGEPCGRRSRERKRKKGEVRKKEGEEVEKEGPASGGGPCEEKQQREGAGDAVLISIWELVSMATEKIWQLHWERLPQQQHPGGYRRRRSQKERWCKQRWEGWEKRQPGAKEQVEVGGKK